MAAHIIYYKNFKIVYDNGLYRVDGIAYGPYLSIKDAKAIIDEITKNDPENETSKIVF